MDIRRILHTSCTAIAVLLLFVTPAIAATVGDSFTIGLSISDDASPPTVPASVVVVPMSSNQIDVSWDASSDDTAVSGYQVFRDSVQVATTSLTSHSDTALSASTTYSYTVVAFDLFNNFSSSSAPVATTTFAAPLNPPAATTSPSGSSAATRLPVPALTSFSVVPGTENAVINFATDRAVRFSLRYGEGSAFNDGILEGTLFAVSHETVITGLKPGTTYEFELTGVDRFGRAVRLRSGSFTTLLLPDQQDPPNVANFTARASGNDVLLSWDTPVDPDFAYVRIVRSHLFFPADPHDGIVVYEGRADEFFDQRALEVNAVQYYTVFSYDTGGNDSSGAVALARRQGVTQPHVPNPATSTASSGVTVRLGDIEVVQDGRVWQLTDVQSELRGGVPFTVRVPYDLFPKHLKVVTVTLSLPSEPNRIFSFLLRANDDFSYYEAALAPLKEGGNYGLSLSVFDVSTEHIYELSGELKVSSEKGTGAPVSESVQSNLLTTWFFWLLLLLVIALLVRLLSRRRSESTSSQSK